MRQIPVFLWLLLTTSVVRAAEIDPPRGEGIVPEGAKLEWLYTRTAPIKGGLTEGPAVAPDGSIYFSDIARGSDNGLILRFDPATKEVGTFTTDSGKTNGLVFDAKGRLVSCQGADYGKRRLAIWNLKSRQQTVLADNYQGKKFNSPNDLCLDRKGRIYFTDPRYLGHESRELEHRAVYRIDPDGSLVELTREVSKPNGIAVSPDQKTLYVADTDNGTDDIDPSKPEPKQGAMRVYAFPLDDEGDICGPRRTIVDFGDEKGCDGMTVDQQGNLYLTVRSSKRPGVMVVKPDGAEIAFIPTGPRNQTASEPVGLPSNVEFGLGEDANMLYVTIDMSLVRIRLKSKGFHHQYP